MQIVIDIPDNVKAKIDDNINACDIDVYDCVMIAVKNGIPLPKGHGRLIDVERLYDDFESMDYDFEDAIEYAPTIIEADKAESGDDLNV